MLDRPYLRMVRCAVLVEHHVAFNSPGHKHAPYKTHSDILTVQPYRVVLTGRLIYNVNVLIFIDFVFIASCSVLYILYLAIVPVVSELFPRLNPRYLAHRNPRFLIN